MSWIEHWQTLIAGLITGFLALVAAGIAYLGAMRQVRGVRDQIAADRTARAEAQALRRTAILWAICSEAGRVESEARVRRRALPSRQQFGNVAREALLISSGPVLRGEMADVALLSLELQEQRADLLLDLVGYNAHVLTRPTNLAGANEVAPMVDQEMLDRLDRLVEACNTLAATTAGELASVGGERR